MIELVVFLGNPGTEYRKTRHNAGWMVADVLSEVGGAPTVELRWQQKFGSGSSGGLTCRSAFGGNTVQLLKPQGFMNRSGDSVQAAANFFKVAAGSCVIVHDDVELPFGSVAFRLGGGSAGHNGLRSVSAALGTPDFWRLRIGIGRPQRGDVSSFVLCRFSPDEESFLADYLLRTSDILVEILSGSARNGPQEIKKRALITL